MTKLEAWHSVEEKRCWKIVRLDTYADVPGEIITADEMTGECGLNIQGEMKTFSFPSGIRLLRSWKGK